MLIVLRENIDQHCSILLAEFNMSIIFTVDYASNVPVKINEYKCWLFLIIFQT